MRVLFDVNNWSRADHFQFYKKFEQPFFGMNMMVPCEGSYRRSKSGGHSFFLDYLYCSLKAVNTVESFRLRIEENDVWLYDSVGAGPTILREDYTFGFAFMPYLEDFSSFLEMAGEEVMRVKSQRGLHDDHIGQDIIHYTTVPWASFTSMQHALFRPADDSVPKIAFGKMFTEGGVRKLPMSVHAHHALLDGYPMGMMVQLFESMVGEVSGLT